MDSSPRMLGLPKLKEAPKDHSLEGETGERWSGEGEREGVKGENERREEGGSEGGREHPSEHIFGFVASTYGGIILLFVTGEMQ